MDMKKIKLYPVFVVFVYYVFLMLENTSAMKTLISSHPDSINQVLLFVS